MSTRHDDFLTLVSLYCDECLTDQQFEQLQGLLRSSPELQSDFVEFVQLHGQLMWDAGLTAGLQMESFDESAEAEFLPAHAAGNSTTARVVRKAQDERALQNSAAEISRGIRFPVLISVVCLVLLGIVGVTLQLPQSAPQVADVEPADEGSVIAPGDSPREEQLVGSVASSAGAQDDLSPLKLDVIDGSAERTSTEPPAVPLPVDRREQVAAVSASDAEIVAEIDRLIRVGWEENNVKPTKAADDHEWIRRTFLTLTGRIPSIEEVSLFVESQSPRKRDQLLNDLLADRQTAENLAVTWTNLLIGRSNSREVNQDSLFAFLLAEFEANRPWIHTVGELVAAKGRSDTNGATNFLLAHLNDQATPATAVTARLFLGQQVHCTQCHDHPFAKERSQDEFWSLNAFFKQAERKLVPVTQADGSVAQVWALEDSEKTGMTFYDKLSGHKKAVLPEFSGQSLSADQTGSRRTELVRFFAADNEHQVARAMINRTWAQFFGYGFTNPVDDIGPHNPVSHPELFDHLTNAFVQSDYDLRRLMKWLSMSEAFQLSSIQTGESFAADDPEEGGTPLFSRSYPRHMGPEQVYESIRTAIRSVSEQPLDSSLGTAHRREWVEQFVRSYGTDENDEQLAFDGNISQALLMMNGEDLEHAIPLAAIEVTNSLRDAAVAQTPYRLAMATLNRVPTENEEKVFRNRYRSLVRSLPPEEAIRTATEDLLWAYLNSSEFVSVH